MTIRTLRPIRWTTFAAIAIPVSGIGLVEFVPAARQRALDAFAESASASADGTVAAPPDVPIGGPFKLTPNLEPVPCPTRSSPMPRSMVLRARPVAIATALTSPWPQANASLAVNSRRPRSSRNFDAGR
jgi:hypothetical protein